jgi:putative flippase GtrA
MRFWRFNGVGVLGFALQVVTLAALLHLEVSYLIAVALSVEAAILHNFVWHERWTWSDRPVSGLARLGRLCRFHALNGAISLAGNLLITQLLVEHAGMPVIPANVLSVIACAVGNYAATERLVFRIP